MNQYANKHYYLIGVAGIGMCGVAKLLLEAGARVSGSDTGDVDHLDGLIKQGLQFYKTHQAEHMALDVDEVIYSVAVKGDNPEMIEAKRRNLPVLKYAQMVGQLIQHKKSLCVAGAHGKTTTSSMMAWILKQAGIDPGYIIGAHVDQLGGSSHHGQEVFVLESCEYDRSFHNYYPDAAIITNIDIDHLDYYSDIQEIQKSFQEFAQNVKDVLLINGDDEFSKVIQSKKVKTFGRQIDCYFRFEITSAQCATVYINGNFWIDINLSISGLHNLYNAVSAAVMAHLFGVSDHYIQSSLESFTGAQRRFQKIYDDGHFIVIDDYAHHPVEIEAVIKATQEKWPNHRKVIIFQPHQQSRTRFLMDDFARVLSQVDLCLLPDIYFVRDSQKKEKEVSSRDLAQAVNNLGGQAVYVPQLDKVPDHFEFCQQDTVVLLLGAGDIWKIGQRLCR